MTPSLASQLHILDLQSCKRLHDVGPLRNMPNVCAWLSLFNRHGPKLDPTVGVLQLAMLMLSETRVRDLSSLATIPSLRIVDLQGCHDVDTSPLQHLPQVRVLHWDER
jgi:hypothetical protein